MQGFSFVLQFLIKNAYFMYSMNQPNWKNG